MGSEVDENEMKSAHVDDTGGEQQGDQESSGTPEANATEPTEPAPAHGAGYGETKIETSEPNDLRAVIERGNHKQLQDLLKGDRARSLLQVKYGGSNGRTDSTDLFSGTTPLLHAAIRGRQDIFSTLLYNSPATLLADRDDGGRTLGHLAALSNDTETFKALLKELVKGRMRRIHIPKRTVLDILTLRDKAGNTVLMIAADVGNDAIFTATVDVMASRLRQDKTKVREHLRFRNVENQTLLQLAALSGKRNAVDAVWKACREQELTFSEMGGSRNFPCGKRPTAMQELRKGNKDNFEAEIEKAKQAGGAEEVIPKLRGIFESEDAIGETLLSHAVYCGEVEMFNLVWDYATSTNCLTPSELGGLIAYQNAFGESLLAKAFDSGKHELFNAVLKCAWELREYLTYHQLRDFIESPDVHEEPRSVAVAHGGDFCTMLLLRAFDLADLGLLEAAVYFVSNRTAVYPDHIVDDVLRKTEQSGSTFWQIVDDLRKSDAFGPHSKVPIKMAEKRSREMNDLLTSLVDEHLNSGTRSDDDLKIISSLVANSAQPDGNGLMKLSRLHKDGDLFKDCCMRAVCSAVNPFIPGITLSIKLAEASKQANEGDRRTISDIQSNVDNLLLEIFERLPQTVDGFEGGIDGCTAIFEPSLLKSSDSGSLEGPLGMILSEQQQLETFCKVPLVMDFLSSKFTLGLRYLNDFQHYRRRIDGMENIGTDLTLDSPVGRFVQTATLTFLPGLQFVVAGMVAAPDSYYQVPAMRMMLDFVVYAIMIAALSNFVLFHSAAGSIAVVDQIVDHRFSVSEGACATIFIAGGILREWREMKRNIRRYFRDQWNVLDALGILCLLIGMVIRWDDWTSPWGPAFYALSAPLVVSRVLFFAQILPFQGPMIQVIFHMTSTLLQFGAVMLVVMIGFAMALHVLFRDVDSFGETFLGLFKAMLGDTDFFDEFSGGRYDRVATILVVIYLFTVTIMLLNLLVAILSTAHAQVQGNTGGTFKVVKARIVDHYRLVVDEDLLPAPFNLVQLLLSMVEVTFAVLYYYVAEVKKASIGSFDESGLDFWEEVARKSVSQRITWRPFGRFVFWLVLGPVAVAGGSILLVLSAFPYAQFARSKDWELFADYYVEDVLIFPIDFLKCSLGCRNPPRIWLLVSFGSLRLLQGMGFMFALGCMCFLKVLRWMYLFVRSAVMAPCLLFGLWFVPVWRAMHCGYRKLRHSRRREAVGIARPTRKSRMGEPKIESMLRKGRGGLGADQLRVFLDNPMDDDDVRQDEKTRGVTVEHLKFLRNRLIKELRKIDGKQLKSRSSSQLNPWTE